MEDAIGRVTGGKMIVAVIAFAIVMALAYATQFVDPATMLN